MYNYKYPRPALTVDAVVYAGETEDFYLLLIMRKHEPYKGKWALPGGFVDMNELLESACIRELKEESGLVVEKMEQFKAFDAIDRDPRHRTISIVFSTRLTEKKKVKGGDDAERAEWFPVHSLPDMAFDHREIINQFFSLSLLQTPTTVSA